MDVTDIMMLHSRVLWKVHSKDHPVAVAYTSDTLSGIPYTTLPDGTRFR
jgi:hypothetical protein